MMSIPEILDQARALNPQERRVLLKALVDILDEPAEPEPAPAQPQAHWGQNLLRLLDELDLSDWEAMEIDDVTEWVRQIRQEQADRLKPYWDGEA